MKKLINTLVILAIITLMPSFAMAQSGTPGLGSGWNRTKPVIIEGGLSRDERGRVLRRKDTNARFKKCYEKELKRTPGLSGKIVVQFVISQTGTVTEERISEFSLENERLHKCVLSVIRSLRFPQPRGGGIAIITYPINFSPK